MNTVQLRVAEKDDAIKVTTLLTAVNDWPGFEHDGTTIDYWQWKYEHNPLGFTNIVVAEAGGKILSHAASLPTEVKIAQKIRLGAQLSDLYTAPDRRGQGLMDSAMTALLAADKEKGIEIELAFPSPAGYDLTLKAGFTEMPVRFGHYELIVNPSQFFQNVRFGALKKVAYEGMRMVKGRGNGSVETVKVYRTTTFPQDIQNLTEAFEKGFDFVFRRDERYLRWRYEHPQSGKFVILASTKNSQTSGYVILRPYLVSGVRYMDIIDLVTMPDDRESLRALLDMCSAICAEEGVTTLQIWLPTDHPYLPELGRKGFLQRQPIQGERRMRLMGRILTADDSLRRAMDPTLRYHTVLGDTDWV